MKPRFKKRTTKKYLFLLSLILLLGTFLVTFLIYLSYQKQLEKNLVQDVAHGFSSTIKALNKASNIKEEIDTVEASNPKILESTQQQIKVIQNVLENSRTQIATLEETKQSSRYPKTVGSIVGEAIEFYQEIESAYSKYLECLQYFDSLNQIISQFQEIEDGVKNQDLLKEVEEKLLLITPPSKLQNFHQSLLSEYQDEEESGSENLVDYNQQIENLYEDFQEKINTVNKKAKEVKQLIIDQQILLKLKPLTVDIESWK